MKLTIIITVLFLVGCAGSLLGSGRQTDEDGTIIAPLDYRVVLADAAKTGANAALDVVKSTPAGQAGGEVGNGILKLLVAFGVLGTGVQTVRRNREAGNASVLATGVRAIETAVYETDPNSVKEHIKVSGNAGIVTKARNLANNHYNE